MSKNRGRVSEQRWPIFTSFSPTLIPGVLASTTKPVIFLPTGASGSVTASTKYQPPSSESDWATPAFVIQSLEPLMT